MSLSLDQMIDSMHNHARRVLIGSATEQIVPFFHVQFKDRSDSVMAAPFNDERNKAAFIKAIRRAMRDFRQGIVNYAFISEAWVAQLDHRPRPDDLPASKREDKREVVIVSAGDHSEARMRVWEIVRDGSARVTDLVEEKHAPSDYEGRLHNLLGED